MTNKTKTVTVFEIYIDVAGGGKYVTRRSLKAARAVVERAANGDNFIEATILRVDYDAEGTTTAHVATIAR